MSDSVRTGSVRELLPGTFSCSAAAQEIRQCGRNEKVSECPFSGIIKDNIKMYLGNSV
jgi:hypothetical protein